MKIYLPQSRRHGNLGRLRVGSPLSELFKFKYVANVRLAWLRGEEAFEGGDVRGVSHRVVAIGTAVWASFSSVP